MCSGQSTHISHSLPKKMIWTGLDFSADVLLVHNCVVYTFSFRRVCVRICACAGREKGACTFYSAEKSRLKNGETEKTAVVLRLCCYTGNMQK